MNDLKKVVSLKSQYEIMQAFQNYESIRLVVSEALGGSSSHVAPGVKPVETMSELMAAFGNIGGKVG